MFSKPFRLEVLNYAKLTKGIFSKQFDISLYEPVLKKEINEVIGLLLSSRNQRKLISKSLKESEWLRKQFLKYPMSIFRISREKELLKIFLKYEKDKLRNLKNVNEEDLLAHVKSLKGKVDGNIKLLKQYGF